MKDSSSNKSLFNKFLVVVVALASGFLAARLVAVLSGDPKASLVSTNQLIITLVGWIALVVVAWLLETQKAISLNWPWHRYKYFREMSKRGKLGTERVLKTETDNAVFVEVMHEGKRRNLVELLQQRLEQTDKPRRFLVVGDAGSGKSTAIEQLRQAMLRNGTKRLGFGKSIPILLELGKYRLTTLFDYAREVFGKDSKILSGVLEKLTQDGHVILLLDAVDEALSSNALDEINQLLSEYPKAAVVITGRRGEHVMKLPADLEVFAVVELSKEAVLAFSKEKIAEYNLQNTPEKVLSTLEESNLLTDGGLGKNPMWLGFILKSGTFANNKIEIFQNAIDDLMKRAWKRTSSTGLWSPELKMQEQLLHSKNALPILANRISLTNQGELCDGEEALKIVESYLSTQTRIEKLRPQDVLGLSQDAELLDFGPLVKKWPPVRFRHKLIREYLSAVELSKDPTAAIDAFTNHAADETRWETLLMLEAIAGSPIVLAKRNPLINAAVGDGQDPRRLFFAIAMMDSVDSYSGGMRKAIIDQLVLSLRSGITTQHIDGATSLGYFSVRRLVELTRELLDRNDATLTPLVENLLSQLFERQLVDGGNSRIIAAFLGDPYLWDTAVAIITKLGPSATPRVTEVLSHPSYSARWHAAQVLGNIGDQRAVEPLIVVLDDSNERVESAAVEALGKLKDARAVTPLFKILHKYPNDIFRRTTIIEAFGNLGTPAIPQLIDILKKPDLFDRMWAIKALKQIGEPAGRPLLEVLKIKSPWPRQSAAEILGSIRYVAAVEPLIELLDCDDIFVEQEAVSSLVLIGQPAVDPLIKALESHKKLEIRKNAAEALGQIGDKRANEPLRKILQDRTVDDSGRKGHAESLLRAEAAEALGNMGDQEAVAVLRDAVDNDRLVVGVYAMASLAQLGNKGALEKVHSWLGGKDPNVQFVIVRSLARVASVESLPYLERFRKFYVPQDGANGNLRRDMEKARAEALRSIDRILVSYVEPPEKKGDDDSEDDSVKTQRDLSGYSKLLKSKDVEFRVNAAKALSAIDESSADLLIEALKDPEPKVRKAAAYGLGDVGRAKALQPLIQVMESDQDNGVRSATAESLGKIGLPEAIPLLETALNDDYLIVRIGAAIGLSRLGKTGLVPLLENVLEENNSPLFRFQIARAYSLIKDLTAIPYLEKSLHVWQEMGVASEDTARFELATEMLSDLKALQAGPAIEEIPSSSSLIARLSEKARRAFQRNAKR